jgi:DNA-binding NarL/FixJ family response regulator
MWQVLIADDHAMARAGYRQFLQIEPGITHIGEAASCAETLQALSAHEWDLLILDMNLPDRSGFDVLTEVRKAHPELRVLVISGFAEQQYADNVVRAGASGYLSKASAPDDFMNAVRAVLRGRQFVSVQPGVEAAVSAEASEGPPHSRLSTREFQIFLKLAAGRSVTEIADELVLSSKTVSTFKLRVLNKLGLESNADLTTYALKNGLMH